MEYRGYDSAGIATLYNNEINEVKSEGRVDNLENNLIVQKVQLGNHHPSLLFLANIECLDLLD